MLNADMHMTLVFLGSNIRGLTPAKRAELVALMEAFSAAASDGQPSLEFEALELFPPAKRNLLIAKYTINGAKLAALWKLQVSCFETGLVSKEEHARSQGNDFVAHVTLGKYGGMRADQLSSVDKTVLKVNNALDQSDQQALALPFEAACLWRQMNIQ